MARYFRQIAIVTLMCIGCDYVPLSTEVGAHVAYHWDAKARRLCGGTVRQADGLIAAMAAHYGLALDDEDGPMIEYFWAIDEELASSVCLAPACAWSTPNGRTHWSSSVVTDSALDVHELAHAAINSHNHGSPNFIDEGIAMRWESAVLGDQAPMSGSLQLSEAEVRAGLSEMSIADQYFVPALSWWAALEASHGPLELGVFLANLNLLSSPEQVDAALRRVLGISLAESVTLAASMPALSFDDPFCEVTGLPTHVWTGEPLVLGRGEARCEDRDIINWFDRAASLFVLEFPPSSVEISIEVTGPRNSLSLMLYPCYGPGEFAPRELQGRSAGTPPGDGWLQGRYIAVLIGDLESDGSLVMPRALLRGLTP